MRELGKCSQCGAPLRLVVCDVETVKTVARGAPWEASWAASHNIDLGYMVEVPVRSYTTETCENDHEVTHIEFMPNRRDVGVNG